MTSIRTSLDPVRTWQTRHCNTHRVVRTLSDVLSDIAEVGPAVWSADCQHTSGRTWCDLLDEIDAEEDEQ